MQMTLVAFLKINTGDTTEMTNEATEQCHQNQPPPFQCEKSSIYLN